MPRHPKPAPIKNLIVVSDLHAGCQLGLCPPDGVPLDDGGHYEPSKFQRGLAAWWDDFWHRWVPEVTRGEPFAVVCNGDALDGVHHGAVTQITHNVTDQVRIAQALLEPIVEACGGHYYHIRGTEAHSGKSCAAEEALARVLRAVPDAEGRHARWELWVRVGDALVHLTHHVGCTSSSSYESTAVFREMVEMYMASGRWGTAAPNIIVRSHRHRHIETKVTGARGQCIAVVTPGWQGRTPFAYRLASARAQPPHFGGLIIRQGDEEFYVREKLYMFAEAPIETL